MVFWRFHEQTVKESKNQYDWHQQLANLRANAVPYSQSKINEKYQAMKKITIVIALCSAALGLTGCFLKPYSPTIQQGNILIPAKVNSLYYGMNKTRVRALLGTPILSNAFSDDYWSYVYSKQVNGGRITITYLTLTFKNNKLAKINDKTIRTKLPAPAPTKKP